MVSIIFPVKLGNLRGNLKVSLGILALHIRVSLEVPHQYGPDVELNVE